MISTGYRLGWFSGRGNVRMVSAASLTLDEARRIATGIAGLPEALGRRG